MAGYSGTPLPKRLGIREGNLVLVDQPPAGFVTTLGDLPPGATLSQATAGRADVILLFATSMARVAERFGPLAAQMVANGGLWVAWPKRSSGVATDLNENVIRDFGLTAGLVDNKVCAIDDTWSGLRFVVRLKDRKDEAAPVTHS